MNSVHVDNDFKMYQIYKSIIILKIEGHFVASPLSVSDTILWARNSLCFDIDEFMEVSPVDIYSQGFYYLLDNKETFISFKDCIDKYNLFNIEKPVFLKEVLSETKS